MADMSNKAVAKVIKQNDSLKGRMKRDKADAASMGNKIAGGVGRGIGAWAGGRWTADKEVKGINIGWGLGLVGLTIQATTDGMGGQFVGGLLEGPMNGLLYKKGESYS